METFYFIFHLLIGLMHVSCHLDRALNVEIGVEYQITEMPLGFQIRMGKQSCGGHHLPPLVGIGLTNLPNSRWAKAHSAHPLKVS